MKKYYKFSKGGTFIVAHKNGGLYIDINAEVQWYTLLSIKYMEKAVLYTECTREECIAAYEQTMKYLNDKINEIQN